MESADRLPLVSGRPQPAAARRNIHNPHSGAVVATVGDATPETVELAIRAAGEGARAMASLTAHRRGEILDAAAEGLSRRAGEVAATICMEAGKPIRDARIEVGRCVTTLRTAAAEARRPGGEWIPLDGAPNGAGRTGLARRFPVGIVTAISPFNFPLNLPAHKVAPALAAGNAVILKPAPRTPLSAFALAEILLASGCPAEAISVIPGDPPVIDPLITDPRIAMVSFTGSAAVGWKIKERCGRKKVALELGGNAGAIVHADADPNFAAARCAAGSFTFSGQVCIRAQRIFVHESVYSAFFDAFLSRARSLTIGDPALETTDLGPMIDAAAAARAWQWVEEAVARGANLELGAPPRRALLGPVVLTKAPTDCRASCEEIFAPVTTLERYSSFDDALDRLDASRYGLQAGIFTNRVDLLFRAFERLHVGAVIHNDSPMFRADPMPYGGIRDSGFGREGVRYAMEEMSELRLLAFRPDPSR